MQIDIPESEQLETIKVRCENWRRCYEEHPKREVSITYLAIEALKNKYDLTDDQKYIEQKRRDYLESQKAAETTYVNVKDYRDAEILNTVWKYLGHHGEADLKIGDTGLNVRTAKIIVFIYTFGNARYRANKSFRFWGGRRMSEWEKQALLFFARRVRLFEKERLRKIHSGK